MRFFEEIAAREDRNLYEIVLYPEGLFYKAYERSAFACVSRVSPFKPSKKHIKYCARDMVSVGFPAAVLPKYFPAAPRPLADGRVVIALTDRIDPTACEMWKASLPLKERQPRGSVRRAGFVLPAVSGTPGGFAAGAEKILPVYATAGAPGIRGGLQTRGEAAVSAGAEKILPNIPGNPAANGRNALPGMPGTTEAENPDAMALPLAEVLPMTGDRAGKEPAGDRTERTLPNAGAERRGLGFGAERVMPNAGTGKTRLGAGRNVPGVRPGRETEGTRAERAVRMIREFRLEAATPVECVLFVADLKKEIDGYL